MPFQPFNPSKTVHNHRGRLPHWRQWGATYFVTSRLADSMPTDILDEWRRKRDAWLGEHGIVSAEQLDQLTEDQRHAYHREFTTRFHELLDSGHGACVLADPSHAGQLLSKFLQGHGTDYYIDAWVIMPNHLHALVQPTKGRQLGRIVQRWKGGSAREINKALGSSGQLWQHELFDHIVRSEAQMDHYRRYIAMNPAKAGLRSGFVLGVGNESGLSTDAVLERFGLQRKAK